MSDVAAEDLARAALKPLAYPVTRRFEDYLVARVNVTNAIREVRADERARCEAERDRLRDDARRSEYRVDKFRVQLDVTRKRLDETMTECDELRAEAERLRRVVTCARDAVWIGPLTDDADAHAAVAALAHALDEVDGD